MKETDPQKQLAAALGRVPSGVFIVTVRHGDAETGMLASWVQQCAFNPPCVSLAIKQGRPVGPWLQPGAVLTVNVLDDSQTDLLIHFGKGFALDQPAFDGLEVERRPDAAPVLMESLAYLDCRVTARYPVADHELIVGEVIGGRLLGEGHPMVHIRKSGMHY